MAGIDRERWAAISRELEALLQLDPDPRAARLAALQRENSALAEELRSLLALATAVEREAFLEKSPDPPPLVAPLLAGRAIGSYTLLKPLGEGGMGAVWLAERTDGRFAGHTAIKFPSLAMLAGRGAERFRREGQILAQLAHPHILRLLDAGITGGQPYLVLEHVEGEPIDAWCDARRLGVPERLHLFLDVLAAVAHAHASLILHRDLKPSNVFVDVAGHVKLLDFGIAKLLDDSQPTAGDTALTQAAGHVFTPDYAAPEQKRGEPLTVAADVYALGTMLFVLLVGALPSREPLAEPQRLSGAAEHSGPDATARRGTTPRQLARTLRGDLDNIVGKCLKPLPAERYASVQALADDLRRYLRHEPVAARADRIGYRTAKFLRRHRFGVATCVLLAVTLAAGVAGTVVQGQRAMAEARAAQLARDQALGALSRAEATSDFLSFLLGSVPVGRSLSVADLAERAEGLAEQQYADDPAMRVRLLLDIGLIYAQMREDKRGLAILHKAEEAARAQPDAGLQAQVACRLADAIGNRDLDDAQRRVDAALAKLSETVANTEALFTCHAAAADIASNRDDPTATIEHAEAALALPQAQRPGQREQALAIEESRAAALAERGQLDAALRAHDAAYAQLAALGRERTLNSASTLNNWGKLLSDAGSMLRAADAYGRAMQIIEAADPASLDPAILGNRAKALAEVGSFDESLALFDRALAAAARTGDDRAIAFTHANAAYARCKAGDWRRCAEHLAAARPAAQRALKGSAAAQLDTIAGWHAQAQGRAEEAAALFERALATYDAAPVLNLRKVLALAGLALAQQASGRPQLARETAQRAVEVAAAPRSGLGHSYWLGEALLARGRVAIAQGDVALGRESLRAAIEQLVPAVGEQALATRDARERLAALP